MKRYLLSLLMIMHVYYVRSQTIVNGDFAINQGNTGSECPNVETPTGGTIIDDNANHFPNWFWTHGSPHFTDDWNAPSPNDIYMESVGPVGEGIVGGYHFINGVTYNLNVIVRYVSNGSHIRMIGAQNPRPFNPLCTEVFCTEPPLDDGLHHYHGTPPIPGDSNHRQELTVPTLVPGNNYFSFTANKDMDWIMIFPWDPSTLCTTTTLTLTALWITRECKDSLVLSDVVIPAGVYNYAENIYAGSQFGPNSTTLISQSTTAIFQAAKQISLLPNFQAGTPANQAYFLAEIVPCDQLPTYYSKNQQNYNNSDESNIGAAIGSHLAERFTLVPNPTNSVVHILPKGEIHYPVTVEITDMVGRLLKTMTFETGEMQMDLSSYSPALYIVNVQTKVGTETFKVIKQ